MATLVGIFNMTHSPFCYMPPQKWNDVRASRSLRADVPVDDEAAIARKPRGSRWPSPRYAPGWPPPRPTCWWCSVTISWRASTSPTSRPSPSTRASRSRARSRRNHGQALGSSPAGAGAAHRAHAARLRSRSVPGEPQARAQHRPCLLPSCGVADRPHDGHRAGVRELLLRAPAHRPALLPARRRRPRHHRRVSGQPARGRRRLRRPVAHATRHRRIS